MGPQHRLAARRRANSGYELKFALPMGAGYSTPSSDHFANARDVSRQLLLLSRSQTKERTGAVDEGGLALKS